MRLSGRQFIVATVSLVVVIGYLASLSCQQRNSMPPTAPTYPGAMLVIKDVTLGNYPHAAEYYTSVDSPDRVVAFYEAHAACYKISKGTACTANASPYGRYTVHINERRIKSDM
jgi:hypothetical protein